MMDTTLRIFSLCTVPISLLLFFLMFRMARRELPAKKRIYMMGIIMPVIMLLVNTIFLSANFNILCGGLSGLFFFIGIVPGILAARNTEMGYVGEVVVAKRSSLPVILWAVSYAVTHLLTVIVPSTGAGIGVVMMFLSTGAAVGMNSSLLWRYREVSAS
jgi:hypothetical protein